jgi:outer membrane protein TolC
MSSSHRFAPPLQRRLAQLAIAAVSLACWARAEPRQAFEAQEGEGSLVTLKQCIDLASSNYASVNEARARISAVEARLLEARTAPFSDFSTMAGIALAPTVRGTGVYSPDTDVALSRNMALAWQVGIQGTLPLWTFGKIDSLQEAAEWQVELKQMELAKVQNEVRLSVRRAYLGVLFARDALALVREAENTIDKHIGKVARAVDEEDADEVTLYRLRMHRADLVAKASEARKQEAIALAGLRFLIGARGRVRVPDLPLPAPKHRLAPLGYYLTAARLHRPEVNMARAAIRAREAQVELERARFYPDIGLTLSGGWSEAPEITDQLNPFVHDPANYLRYGAALGLRWKLDLLPQSARLSFARAQLEEIRATEQYAIGGVGVEVTTAYEEARDAERRLSAYEEAREYARRWLITVQQGLDIGAYDSDDVIAPAKEYALGRFNVINATYDYHIALARLAMATGWDAVAPETL